MYHLTLAFFIVKRVVGKECCAQLEALYFHLGFPDVKYLFKYYSLLRERIFLFLSMRVTKWVECVIAECGGGGALSDEVNKRQVQFFAALFNLLTEMPINLPINLT